MGKFTEFNLPLKTLSVGTHEFDYHLDKQFFVNMESDDIRDANLDVHLNVVYRNDVYSLSFAIVGEVTLLCDRCLDEMQFPIDADYEVDVKYGDDYKDDSDELIEIPFSESMLNVSYMIYDTVSLAIPIKHVHPVGQCNREMSAVLRRHKTTLPGDEDVSLEENFLDDIDENPIDVPNDPRWDVLKGLNTED